jgi:hypothetical protein
MHAAWCLGSCWALMLVSPLAPAWHLAVMLVVSVWMWVEPLDRPERPTWRVRLPLRFLRIAGATVRSLPQRVLTVQARPRARPGWPGLAGPPLVSIGPDGDDDVAEPHRSRRSGRPSTMSSSGLWVRAVGQTH